MSDVYAKSLELHLKNRGKIAIQSKVSVNNQQDLTYAYSPGVASSCLEIVKDEDNANLYTNINNTIAIVSDGSAVLGLGDIGPKAALPVMEGKSILFKKFADIDAWPLCIKANDEQAIIDFCQMIEPSVGAILLEDIKAPRCVVVERKLQELLNIPVFHDDQHGTAIIAIAAVMNTLRLTKKAKEEVRVVVSGCGAAGSSIIKLLAQYGIKHIEGFDIFGQLRQSDKANYHFLHQELLEYVNLDNQAYADLGAALVGADIFIGVSAPNIVSPAMVAKMNKQAAVFALANPNPEISYDLAKEAGAYIVGSGRSDYPNQVNNVLAFPGLFKGALRVKATKINDEMKLACAKGLADLISDEELNADYIIPKPFDERVVEVVAKEVSEMAIKLGFSKCD